MVELNDHCHKATALELDNEKNLFVRTIACEESPSKSLAAFLKSLPLKKKRPVIIALDPKRMMTVLSSVALVRDDEKEEITEGELHNLVSRAVWLALNRYRPQASERLSAGAHGVVLAHLRLLGVRVDGREVLNPQGIRARKIEFDLEQSFLPRALAEEIQGVFHRVHSAPFFLESGVSFARLVSRILPDEVFALAELSRGTTELYRFTRETRYIGAVSLPRALHISTLPWGGTHLEKNFEDYFNVGQDVAKQLVQAHADSETSPFVQRALQKISTEAIERFLKETTPHLKKKEVCYWNSPEYSLPEFVSAESHAILKKVSCAELLYRFGFKPHVSGRLSRAWQSAIPIFLDYYYAKEGHWLNRLANQRAKWFIP